MGEVEGHEGLPEYASLLAARHAAHAQELSQFVANLWKNRQLAVLDVACGDGFYTAAFDQCLGARSRIIATDVSAAFLKWASDCRWLPTPSPARVEYVAAEAERLPFGDATFDLVWCAQSLISLPRPIESLREMARVTRAGGTVAILENDRLHELQLPWPVSLEFAVRHAERSGTPDTESAEKPYSGRFLEDMLLAADLTPKQRFTLPIQRQFPLSSADEAFFQAYFHALLEKVEGQLPSKQYEELKRLCSAGSDSYLPSRSTFWMTWTDEVVLGIKQRP